MLPITALMLLIERYWPANALPRVKKWWPRVVNICQIGIVLLIGISWEGFLNNGKLHEFSQHVCANEKSSYSYIATLGLTNGNTTPQSTSEFEDKYTCTTLVIAAPHHSGLQLHTPRRNGFLDIITPRQVVDSWGCAILPK